MNIDNLRAMINQGHDSLILRFGLAQALLKQGEPEEAIEHLLTALQFEPEYSAAFKLLGKAYAETQQNEQAIETYEKGIKIAEAKGDIQAAKEMKVFFEATIKSWLI